MAPKNVFKKLFDYGRDTNSNEHKNIGKQSAENLNY